MQTYPDPLISSNKHTMKTRIIVLITATATVIACSTSKKRTATPPAPVVSSTTEAPVMTKPLNGIYEPGHEELIAIQARYKDATLEQLKQGHMIYSLGACIQCHKAMSIYQRNEAQWAIIIDDMAKRARISETQKDAVYKYVLAVKAARANQGR
jgi:hypothetical protein